MTSTPTRDRSTGSSERALGWRLGAAGKALVCAAAALLSVRCGSSEPKSLGTPEPAGCPLGQTSCAGSCVDLSVNSAHCGACDTPCDAGTSCSGGMCQCQTGFSSCEGQCLDVQSSALHCGACDTPCQVGQLCQTGACACQEGLIDCSGSCADLASDGANCGACGSACTAGEVCSAGACAASCGADLTQCGTSCVDTQSSVQHCGGCDTPCPTGESCAAGACTCLGGQTACGGQCVDTESNPAHCGACGNVCSGGRVCEAEQCVCPNPGETFCAGSCTSTEDDEANCGACGNQCAPGESCDAGSCVSGGMGGSLGTGGASTTQVSTTQASTTQGGSGGAGPSSTGGVTTTAGGTSAGGVGGNSGGGGSSGGSTTVNPDFILGADVSSTLERESNGAVFCDGGSCPGLLPILKAHGFNFVRLRTWVDPTAPGGYAAGQSEGWCDLEHTITMAQRVKSEGMGLLLNFHYSDTWTDPGNQTKPSAWASLSGSALQTALYDYTYDVVNQLKNAGATPDIVQPGNEITSGLLHDDGKNYDPGNWDGTAALLKEAVSAIKAVDANIRIMMHIDTCDGGDGGTGAASTTVWWVDSARDRGVDFDILGFSCYTTTQGSPDTWEEHVNFLASRYPDLQFAAAEYSQEKRRTNDIFFDLGDQGLGTFIFEPIYWYETIFDEQWPNYNANSFMDVYDQMASDYGL